MTDAPLATVSEVAPPDAPIRGIGKTQERQLRQYVEPPPEAPIDYSIKPEDCTKALDLLKNEDFLSQVDSGGAGIVQVIESFGCKWAAVWRMANEDERAWLGTLAESRKAYMLHLATEAIVNIMTPKRGLRGRRITEVGRTARWVMESLERSFKAGRMERERAGAPMLVVTGDIFVNNGQAVKQGAV